MGVILNSSQPCGELEAAVNVITMRNVGCMLLVTPNPSGTTFFGGGGGGAGGRGMTAGRGGGGERAGEMKLELRDRNVPREAHAVAGTMLKHIRTQIIHPTC